MKQINIRIGIIWVVWVLGCNILQRKTIVHHTNKDSISKNESIKKEIDACEVVKEIVAKCWFYNPTTQLYGASNVFALESLPKNYPECFQKENTAMRWQGLLGKPHESNENRQTYYWVYYQTPECFQLRKSAEMVICNCYMVSISKANGTISIKDGTISQMP